MAQLYYMYVASLGTIYMYIHVCIPRVLCLERCVHTVTHCHTHTHTHTPSYHHRYNSLSEAHRQAFGADEDYLLSLILHSLLVYMLSLGKSAGETTDIVHRLTARTRLSTVEEKQLQKTLRLIENNVREINNVQVLSFCAPLWMPS